MADVRPFRAVRYARPSAEVTAPPYDVIDAASCDALRAGDPHNIVHLTFETNERAAAARLARWLDDGTLVRDQTPAVWFLEQDFVGPDGVARRRDGIVASLRVEPYATGSVLPHERTHSEPLAGRLRLLRATRTQLEPIFLLYEGTPPLARPAAEPDLEIEGTRLWRLEGDHGVESFFAPRQLLIADGHHRYEAAVAFAAQGVFRLDANELDGAQNGAHAAAWMAWLIGFAVGGVLLGAGLRGAAPWRTLATLSLGTAVLLPVVALVLPAFIPAGHAQRLAFGLWFAWAIAAEARIATPARTR